MEDIYNIIKTKEYFKNGYLRYLKEELRREIKRGTYIFEDETYCSWLVKKNHIKITKLVSKNERQGKGTKIFSKFLSRYKNIKKILKVHKENHNAIRFYEKFNFKKVKLEKDILYMECNE